MLFPQLETSEHAPAYHLLQLFAYGTLLEYNSKPLPTSCCCLLCLPLACECERHTAPAKRKFLACAGRSSSLPPITEEQRLKLRQLTIISIAEEKKVGTLLRERYAKCG